MTAKDKAPAGVGHVVKIKFFKDGEPVVLDCDCASLDDAYAYALKHGAEPFKMIQYTFA